MPQAGRSGPSKHPWWFTGNRSRRTALGLAALWLAIALLGLTQVVIADSSLVRWLGGLQCLAGVALTVMYQRSAVYIGRHGPGAR